LKSETAKLMDSPPDTPRDVSDIRHPTSIEPQPPDADIVARVVGGDTDAFELLVARYRFFVHAIASRHVPADRAEEVAHDVFVSAFRNLAAYSGKGAFRHWLARITVRRCCDFWRERERRREVPLSQITDDCHRWLDDACAAESVDSSRCTAARHEAKELLDYALDKLSALDRTIITLVFLDGHSVAEAAQLVGCNSVVVRVRAHRAKNRMRKIISGLLEKADYNEKGA
jgi:RNA polymerase sigma-70 factor (ECF subfamily)